MSHARVQSIQAVADFQEYLQHFRRCLLKELEALESELGKVSGWMLEDAYDYWVRERQLIQRNLTEYQQQLSRCLSSVRADEQRPCTEEKKRVYRAQQRLQLCEDKIRKARAAVTQWETRKQKLRTRIEHCRDLADADLSVAGTRLGRHLGALESYANLSRQSRVYSDPQRAASDGEPELPEPPMIEDPKNTSRAPSPPKEIE